MVVHLPHTHPDKVRRIQVPPVGFHEPVEAVLREPARPLVAPRLAGPIKLITCEPLADLPHALGTNGQPARITQEPIWVMKSDIEPHFRTRPPDRHPDKNTQK